MNNRNYNWTVSFSYYGGGSRGAMEYKVPMDCPPTRKNILDADYEYITGATDIFAQEVLDDLDGEGLCIDRYSEPEDEFLVEIPDLHAEVGYEGFFSLAEAEAFIAANHKHGRILRAVPTEDTHYANIGEVIAPEDEGYTFEVLPCQKATAKLLKKHGWKKKKMEDWLDGCHTPFHLRIKGSYKVEKWVGTYYEIEQYITQEYFADKEKDILNQYIWDLEEGTMLHEVEPQVWLPWENEWVSGSVLFEEAEAA